MFDSFIALKVQSFLDSVLSMCISFLILILCVCVFFFPSCGMVVAQMKVLKLLAIVVVGFVFVVVLILELVHDKTQRKLIIGTLCAVFAVGMYASPLTIMVSNLIR